MIKLKISSLNDNSHSYVMNIFNSLNSVDEVMIYLRKNHNAKLTYDYETMNSFLMFPDEESYSLFILATI